MNTNWKNLCKVGVGGSLAAFLILALCIRNTEAALLTTDLAQGPFTPEDIALHITGGDGIPVSNATLTGSTHSAGTFSGGADPNGGTGAIPFATGVVLSSGRIDGVIGPNSTTPASTAFSNPGDPHLSSLVESSTRDATVLEFDIVPDGNRIMFRYIFLSEEYNTFVNGNVNDVFGFFVNGVNCAVVGNPPQSVNINTINNGNPFNTTPNSNPGLYINNDVEDQDPSGGDINTGMNGLTVVLTCSAPVNPNVPNHIKLAIADVGDATRDSNVFIESGSLTIVPPPPLSVNNPNGAVCNDARCTVPVMCDSAETTNCRDRAVITVNRSFSKGEVSINKVAMVDMNSLDSRAPMIRMAAGVSNIPPGSIGKIKIKLTNRGKKVVANNKGRRIRGVMTITNAAGNSISSTSIRLRIR